MGWITNLVIVLFFIGLIFIVWSNFTAIAGEYVVGGFEKEINKNSSSVREVAQIIRAKCHYTKESSCLVFQASSWVGNNIKYRNLDFFETYFGWNTDTDTIYKKGGNCRQIAIFTASLWRELGFKDIYLLMSDNGTDSHIFAGLSQEKSMVYSNNIENLTIYQVHKVV